MVRTHKQALLLKLRVGIEHMACFYSYDLGDRILFEIVILTEAAAEACGSWCQLLQQHCSRLLCHRFTTQTDTRAGVFGGLLHTTGMSERPHKQTRKHKHKHPAHPPMPHAVSSFLVLLIGPSKQAMGVCLLSLQQLNILHETPSSWKSGHCEGDISSVKLVNIPNACNEAGL